MITSEKMLSQKKYDLYHAIFGFPSGMVPFLIKKYPYIVSLRGSDVPGFMNPRFGRSLGRGFGRGRGFAWRTRAMQVAMPIQPVQPTVITEKQEKQFLEQDLEALKEEMKEVEKRLKEIKQ